MRLLLCIVLLVQSVYVSQSSQNTARRLPLQKKEIALKSPTTYAQRFLGMDPKTGKEMHYDPKPEVVPLDAKSGTYGLRWIGYDGRPKTIIYHRPDAFDAIISASARRHSSGQYLYTYTVRNLIASKQNVNGFAVQNFAIDVHPKNL